MIAIVIGGAECVWNDVEAIEKNLPMDGVKYFITNSMISHLARPGIAVTLHPDLLAKWLAARGHNNLPDPELIFTHRPFPNATVFRLTWRGSVSLFAVEIARKHFGFTKTVLCGCPMTIDGGHFERKKPWGAANKFREGWIEPMQELKPYLRSMSGWTREQFGLATKEWLMESAK